MLRAKSKGSSNNATLKTIPCRYTCGKFQKFLESHLSIKVWPQGTFEIYYLLVIANLVQHIPIWKSLEEKAHTSLGQGHMDHFLAPVFSLTSNDYATVRNSMPKPQAIYAPFFPGVGGGLHWQVYNHLLPFFLFSLLSISILSFSARYIFPCFLSHS